MKNYITVELGRVNIKGNEIRVELGGKSKNAIQDMQGQILSVGSVIDLEKNYGYEKSANIFVNGKLQAKGYPIPIVTNMGIETMGVIITEAAGRGSDNSDGLILIIAKDRIIELGNPVIYPDEDNNPYSWTYYCDIVANGVIIAKGSFSSSTITYGDGSHEPEKFWSVCIGEIVCNPETKNTL